MAAIIFLTVFFALGTLLILLTHRALVAEEARCIAKLERAPAIREESMQSQLQDQPRDRAA
jgi:hypothetical protein